MKKNDSVMDVPLPSDRLLGLAIDQAPLILWAVDRDLRFIAVYGGGCKDFNVDLQSVIGEKLGDFFAAEGTNDYRIVAHRRALMGESVNIDIELEQRILESRLEPFRNEKGDTLGVLGMAIDITGRVKTEDAMNQTEARYRQLVERINVATYLDAVDEGSSAMYMSPQSEAMFGYTCEEWLTNPNLWPSLIYPEDREAVLTESARTNQTGEPFRREYRMVARDGHIVWVQDEAILVRDEDGNPYAWHGMLLDITERKKADAAIKSSEQKYRQLFHTIGDPIFISDQVNGHILDCNETALHTYGYSIDELCQMSLEDLIDVRETRYLIDGSHGQYSDPSRYCVHHTKDGRKMTVEIRTEQFEYETRLAWISVVRDITERMRAEQLLLRAATFDALTDLPNRVHFFDKLNHAILLARRHRYPLVVMYLDFDGFKSVNDLYGHDKGDLLLKVMADRLRISIRESDTVARFGGDEFCFIIERIRKPKDIALIAEKILRSVSMPFKESGDELQITASLGISLFPQDGRDSEGLIKCADVAMYRAKQTGKNRYKFYSGE